MDWITGLQKAIDYIEENLTEELDYDEIARRACSSSFHFQRIFGILCGYTLGEYIRNRRLTMAGSELAASGGKVIDVALKYGYDSPESFSRAFTRFHEIAPSQAKSNAAMLKSFSPLFVKLILEGGTIMNYRVENRGAFPAVMKKTRFEGGCDLNQKQIADFWRACNTDGTIPSLCQCMADDSALGKTIIGITFDSPEKSDFDYAVGAVYDGHSSIPSGLVAEKIPAATWIVFPCKGAMPEAFQELYGKIYTEFFPTSEYQPQGGMYLEVYPGDNITDEDYACEIWVSVEKK